ncbi:MAG: hypothetical protein B655_0277 [Methanobacterium sp. Maddingley MBC34]|nr:MAG: hypothetical protein B655_0277 [Methanobacterium sp. Maddingley MBC34]
MPDFGPMGRGGARRRTRRRMTLVNEMRNSEEQKDQNEPEEVIATDVYSDKLEKLAKLLKDKGVITETEYNLIFD